MNANDEQVRQWSETVHANHHLRGVVVDLLEGVPAALRDGAAKLIWTALVAAYSLGRLDTLRELAKFQRRKEDGE